MQIIKVFPDYCSSGLWDSAGSTMSESTFEDVLNDSDLIALKYWHAVWEWFADYDININALKLNKSFWDRWSKDGKNLVDSFNSKQDEFLFIYEGDYWK